MSNGGKEEKILLVGAGNMGIEYAKVLNALKVPYTTVTRGEEKAKVFQTEVGCKAITGGIDKFLLDNEEAYRTAIVGLPIDEQKKCVISLIHSGVKRILLEKPGALYTHELHEMNQAAEANGAVIKIAYNRRFYNSVLEAERIIEEDGGISSIFFEFTELECEKKEDVVRHFIGNSTHVVDLAFYFGGIPKTLYGISRMDEGNLAFSGTGITEKNILCTYMANYLAPGRWGVEVMTAKHRLIFRPMEKLHIQELKSFHIDEWEIKDQDDILFKPGLYKEVKTFLYDTDNKRFLSCEEQEAHMSAYDRIIYGTENVNW